MNSHRKRRLSHLATRLTFLLFFLILLFDFADQSLINPLINPLLKDFFNNISNVIPIGWISFTFTLLSAVSMMVAGILADKKSRLKLCFWGGIIYCTFSILTVFTPHGPAGYVFYFITRALNGIGVGIIVPTIFSMVGDTVAAKKRTTAFAYISLAMLAGRMAGFAIAGAVGAGWRNAYFLLGLINLLLVFGLLWLKEPRRGSQEEEIKALILDGAEYRFRIKKEDFKLIKATKSNFWLVLNFIDVIPGAIILFLIFKYMKDVHNLGPNGVNLLIVFVMVLGGIGTIFFGKMGDRWFQKNKRAKVWLALLCNILPIFFFLIFLLLDFEVPDRAGLAQTLAIPGFIIITAAVGLAIFINQGVNPNWYSTLTDINLPEHRATIISLASVMDITGNAMGPLVGSYIATLAGLKAAMWSVMIFWLINILFWLPVLRYITDDLDRVHARLLHRARQMKNPGIDRT